jgi:hypothetical protein
MTANEGASDLYQGGDGVDTLTLKFTETQWSENQAIQTDIAGYQAHLASESSDSFEFAAFGLTASEFEKLSVRIGEGDATDMTVAPVEDMVLEYGDFAGFAPFGPENIMAEGGEGNDTITFGDFAAHENSLVTVDGGGGGDTISFESVTGINDGNVTVNSGAGDDVVSVGDYAGLNDGNVSVNGGAGADTFIFGVHAENLTIDLGEGYGDIDSLTFEEGVFNTTIDNWEYGVDANIDVVDPTAWTAQIENGNTVLTTNDNQSLTFIGITDANLNVSDFLI